MRNDEVRRLCRPDSLFLNCGQASLARKEGVVKTIPKK